MATKDTPNGARKVSVILNRQLYGKLRRLQETETGRTGRFVSLGEIVGRLVVKDEAQRERMQSMGIRDTTQIYETKDLAPGRDILFAACGVTDGNLLRGARFFGDGIRTHAVVMTSSPARVRFVDSVNLENRPDVKVRFQ